MKKLGTWFLALVMIFSLLPATASAGSTADDIVNNAKKHIGVPYLFGGTTPAGFDCSGYARYVFNESGISLPRTTGEQYSTGQHVAKSNLQKGDLVFFNTSGRGVSHSGIYMGGNQFIHASSSRGIIISDINDPYYWGSRYIGARRVFEDNLVEVKAETADVLPVLPKGEYHDVKPGHWAHQAIHTFTMKGIVKGDEQSRFLPSKGMTRGEVAEMIAAAKGLKTSNTNAFKDVVAGRDNVSAIAAVNEAGIMSGVGNGLFHPNRVVTRAELAATLSKAFGIHDRAAFTVTFTDVDASNWAYSSIRAMAGNKFIGGYEDNTFRPGNDVTKAEAASMLFRVMN
ncbi:S-layer homology domain-containing protein [Paenalkalicoccus suaedae]|uniref:S-layer homology domain-containing protein n=1 Tax=Paenalkalicoccus suaedae TaxID=2592382 RepID=A0A859FJ93_9BACI|nr:C40 family peptidase [Paenalkalicoccus suaedae]QKS72696.1 S-layer homology domain-containing protein [Paenalkalicoccus suaedae]